MKRLISLLFALIPFLTFAQREVNYSNIPESKALFNRYITKDGHILSLRDTLVIGIPSGLNGFRFITQDGQRAEDVLAGRKVEVKRIRTFKRQRLRNKVFFEFRAYGILPFQVDYEMALKTGEIQNPSLE